MKKAFLVEYCVRTRVVVDDNDDVVLTENNIVKASKEKILSDASNYIITDNIVSVEEDVEMPYDPEFDE